MNTPFKKLLEYSAQAGAFLILPTSAGAQVIYHNIDPDSVFENDGNIQIDFNADGVNDLDFSAFFEYDWTFWTDGTEAWWGDLSVIISNFSAVISNMPYPDSYGALDLMEGFSINNSANWNLWDTIKLIDYNSYDSYIYAYSAYNNWNGSNKYLGVKFLISGEEHYGWVRLSITNDGTDEGLKHYTVAVQDYAYEAMPGVPLVITNQTSSIAEHVFISDDYDFQNASDFTVEFEKSEFESTVSAYRIFIYPYSYLDPTPPSLAFWETLPPERFFDVLPIGAPSYSVSLPAAMFDINGNPILTGYPSYYKAIIVSIADGAMVTQNNVSVPSNPILNSLTIVGKPYYVHITESGNNCDITDFDVTFHKPNDETGIAEYRVYILNDLQPSASGEDVRFYESIIPNGSTTYFVSPSADKLIFEDSVPILFHNYYTEILVIADGIEATYSNSVSTRYYESSYYGNIYGEEAQFYCEQYNHMPVISFIDFTKTPADIRVQFNGPSKIFKVDEYRIYIVPEADTADFTPEIAKNIPEANYMLINPPVTDLDVVLPANLPDIYGNLVAADKRYAVMIALIENASLPKISVSFASETFNLLSDEGNIALPYSYIYENNLYVMSNGNFPYLLNLYNMAGEKVLSYEITTTFTIIELNDIAKGIYIIKATPTEEMPTKKIFVGHSDY